MSESAIDISEDVTSRMYIMAREADELAITSELTYRAATSFLLGVKDLQKEILEFFSPLKSRAHAAWKGLCAAETAKVSPLLDVERTIKHRMLGYETEQRRIAAEKEAILRAEARKIEEDARLKEAMRLESQGHKREAERVIEAPIFTPPIKVAPPTPQVQGISFRETWGCEVDDLRALCRAIADGSVPTSYVTASMPALNQRARADKESFAVPGCRAVVSKQVAAGGR